MESGENCFDLGGNGMFETVAQKESEQRANGVKKTAG